MASFIEKVSEAFPDFDMWVACTDRLRQDKHAKQLATKLAARLQRAENKRQWDDVAYALGLLPHKNEEISKLVGDGCKIVEAAA